jgi:hypothetical protein
MTARQETVTVRSGTAATTRPALRTFANLWTLWDHPGRGPAEWSAEQKIAAVAAAGFDGVMGDPGQRHGRLAADHGLQFAAFRRLDQRDDVPAALALCRDEGAIVLQVHLGWHDTSADEGLALALGLRAAAQAAGLETVIETHRDTCTETPEKTAELGRRYRLATGGEELPLLYDFSHHAVVKHLDPPFADRLLADPAAIGRARWHHLRPFNGHHAQIPVLAPDGTLAPEMDDWLVFAATLLRLLRQSPHPEIWVCPEIGPVRGGYGLASFPPSWDQAVDLHARLRELWVAAGPDCTVHRKERGPSDEHRLG